jgi:hypothetical protein
MSQTPSVTIVILNWNNAPDTIECLESVAGLDYPNFRPLVVDNGSSDDSVTRIRQAQPTVAILETGENLGYAEGNNVGLRQAVENGADYVFVLNNDTLLEPTMLTKLVEVAESSPDIGMVGPTMYCTDPAKKLFAAGSFVLWSQGKLNHRGMFELPGPYTQAQTPEPVDFIVGCGVLVRRELIERCGPLDPQYYLNFEDVEWGIRARRYGYQVLYVPPAVMWHKVSATLGQASAANTYYMTRNALLFFWKNGQGFAGWLAVLRILLHTSRTIGAWSLKSQYRNQTFRRKRSANLMALRDFFQGRYGAMGSDVFHVCYDN